MNIDHQLQSKPHLEQTHLIQKPSYLNSLLQATQEQFHLLLVQLTRRIKTKQCLAVLTNKQLQHKILWHYYNHRQQQKMSLPVLALLAQIVQILPQARLPFSRKIIKYMLSFQCPALKQHPQGLRILSILSVLIFNMSRQISLLKRLGVYKDVIQGVFELLTIVQDIFSLKMLFKALYQLHRKSELFQKYNFKSKSRNNIYENLYIMKNLQERGIKDRLQSIWGKLILESVFKKFQQQSPKCLQQLIDS